MSTSAGILTPNETVTGTPAQRDEILSRLARFRREPEHGLGFGDTHPHVSFRTLDAVALMPDDRDVLDAGLDLIRDRYAALGLTALLPLERVFVGLTAILPAHGGFHHPDQGYRYVQACSVVTRYGDLTGAEPPAAGLVGLDLVRAYAHDCLHYGTFRSYRLGTVDGTFGIHRNQHGINFRRENGRSYSARDADGSASTRNLGVIMEGAIDREATALARAAATAAKVPCPPDGIDLYAFRDCTGNGAAAPDDPHPWLSNMSGYARTVTARYAGFLAEIAGLDETELHDLITRTILRGNLAALQDWLDGRFGPGEFTALFRSPTYVPS